MRLLRKKQVLAAGLLQASRGWSRTRSTSSRSQNENRVRSERRGQWKGVAAWCMILNERCEKKVFKYTFKAADLQGY